MDAHEELLSEWAEREHHHGKGFICDGIIDPIRWAQARKKVLLLLKEAYGKEPGIDWDLRFAICQPWPKRVPTWWNAAYWCYAALTEGSHIPEFPSADEDYDAARDALRQCAIVNIKKSGGSSRSGYDDLFWYAERDRDLIKRQVELINPEIVICGYTWGAVQGLWPAREIYDLVWKTEQFTVIDFWHPANPCPDQLKYYALGCLIQNAGLLRST